MKTTNDLNDLEVEALQMIEAWGTALRERDEARETAMRLEEELARTTEALRLVVEAAEHRGRVIAALAAEQ